MTREECIYILDKYAHHSRYEVIEYPRKVATEVFETAIAALKAKPCEDAVSLDSVIDTIEWYRTNPQHFTEDNLIEDIKGLPPVTPKLTECEDCVSIKTVMHILAELGYGDEENGADIEYMSALHDVAKKVKALSPVTPKQMLCKDCKFFEYDHMENVEGIPLIVAHEICNKWGDGCRTSEDGYCFLFKPKEGEKIE